MRIAPNTRVIAFAPELDLLAMPELYAVCGHQPALLAARRLH